MDWWDNFRKQFNQKNVAMKLWPPSSRRVRRESIICLEAFMASNDHVDLSPVLVFDDTRIYHRLSRVNCETFVRCDTCNKVT